MPKIDWQKLAEIVVGKLTDQLLIFGLIVIVLASYVFPEHQVSILILGMGIAALRTLGKIVISRERTGNPEIIPSRDLPRIKERMLADLKADQQQLNILIALIRSVPSDVSIDNKYKINSSRLSFSDYHRHLQAIPASRHDNKDEIEMLWRWEADYRKINKELSNRRRVEFLDENELEITESLQELIDFYDGS